MSSELPLWCLQSSSTCARLTPITLLSLHTTPVSALQSFSWSSCVRPGLWFYSTKPGQDPVLNGAFGRDHSTGKDNYSRAPVLLKTAKMLHFRGLLTCQLLIWCAKILREFDALPFRSITCNRCGRKKEQKIVCGVLQNAKFAFRAPQTQSCLEPGF